ncbi:hypothetical protein P154DRAFT_619260 [Amniculicola lignicola CBS 123094]|uniref:Uncharacterized protein n=1 Tax=Amniculicola lignicola CBS 123094 TaxID=1392246 RepID=A0A6A5WR77_9PLEO|nr:hypothetical protein P154DRAFT_619260 [Amniculicola lignicola CBS 123094]
MALHSVFLAGLTLVYCVWISPKEVFNLKTSNDMNACSIVLYIITERWPAAKRYRDVFESVKQTVMESIEENGYEQRKVIKSLRPGLEETLKDMDSEEGRQQFEAMMTDMAGEPTSNIGMGKAFETSPTFNGFGTELFADEWTFGMGTSNDNTGFCDGLVAPELVPQQGFRFARPTSPITRYLALATLSAANIAKSSGVSIFVDVLLFPSTASFRLRVDTIFGRVDPVTNRALVLRAKLPSWEGSANLGNLSCPFGAGRTLEFRQFQSLAIPSSLQPASFSEAVNATTAVSRK